MATAHTTTEAPKGWAPDVTAFAAADVVPTALVMQVATFAGTVEGDAPAVRVAYVADDGPAGFVPEGAPIPESAPDLTEAVISTGKVANLGRYSRELFEQPHAAESIVNAMTRAVINKADAAFLSNAANPTGLLNVAGIGNAGTLGANLDTLADAITAVEADGGMATHIIASPDAWGAVAKLKTASGSAAPLLGAGSDTIDRRVLGVPVLTTRNAPAGTLLVVDSRTILAAYGPVNLARSEDAYFASDSIAARVTWRFGFAVQRPARVVKLTTKTA